MPVDISTRGYLEVWRDGVLVSRHSVETEAMESILNHADLEANGDGEYEIRYPRKTVVTRLRKKVVPFSWRTITASFAQGTASSVNLASFLTNPSNYAITYAAVGSLPSGVTLTGSTLAYNGTGAAASSSVTFTATNAGLTATSAATTVTIAVVNQAPYWTQTPLPAITRQAGETVSLAAYAADPENGALTWALVSPPAGYSIAPTTGLLTVGSASGTITVRVTDPGGLSATTTCAVTVEASTGSGTYTPTHYVTATATGTGNGTLGSPWTLQQAMAQAVAGNRVQVGPGVYSGTKVLPAVIPVFNPANNGTAGNPIVFFAQYPAAYNYGQTTRYSELRVANQTTGAAGTYYFGPVLGAYAESAGAQRHHIIFDGFYTNFLHAFPSPSKGCLLAWFSNDIEFRRCAIDASNPVGVTGYDNFNTFFVAFSQNIRIVDCLFNGYAADDNNSASIETYSSTYTVEYCTFNNVAVSVFAKGHNSTHYIRYNRVNGAVRAGLVVNVADPPSVVHNNLMYNLPSRGIEWNNSSNESAKTQSVYNNTVILNGPSSSGEPGNLAGHRLTVLTGFSWNNSSCYNNIFMGEGNNAMELVADNNATNIENWVRFNYNVYYNQNAATLGFYKNYARSTTLAQWKTAVAPADANSIYADPLFVSIASDDFRLQVTSPARAAGFGGAVCGCYVTGSEEIGLRTNPVY